MSIDNYLDVIMLVEQVHSRYVEVVKREIDSIRIQNINNVQALMLYNIGDIEMTVGELTLRGCYRGSNVAYNVKKMVENGYLATERSRHDQRSIRVRLTEKGRNLRDQLNGMHSRHIETLAQSTVTEADLQRCTAMLGRLERFWTEAGNPFGSRDRDLPEAAGV